MPRIEVKVVLVPNHEECIVWCGGRKLSFQCNLPLDKKMEWEDLRGNTVDDRSLPQPPNFEPLRPLRQISPREWGVAKQRAFGILQKARREALQKIERAALEPTFL